MKSLFDQFDRDGNGSMDCKELKAFLERLNIEATPECLNAMFKAMDKDGNISHKFPGFFLVEFKLMKYDH